MLLDPVEACTFEGPELKLVLASLKYLTVLLAVTCGSYLRCRLLELNVRTVHTVNEFRMSMSEWTLELLVLSLIYVSLQVMVDAFV